MVMMKSQSKFAKSSKLKKKGKEKNYKISKARGSKQAKVKAEVEALKEFLKQKGTTAKDMLKSMIDEHENEKSGSDSVMPNENGSSFDDLSKVLYKPLPNKDKKVKLDSRFKEIFTNPEFSGVVGDHDQRGARRFVETSKQTNLPKYESDSDAHESDASDKDVDSEDEETDLEDEWRRMSDEEECVWDSIDPSAVDTLDEATRRLCLKHMDWNKVKAKDIYTLVKSFVPASGALFGVTVYPSEEGVKNLPNEERHGPSVISDLDAVAEEEGVLEAPDEEETFETDKRKKKKYEETEEVVLTETQIKRLNKCRKYEIERLKYFYAILDFDSPETANAVYEAIDGVEYEASGCRIDLYFVEDDRVVDKHLKGVPNEDYWASMISCWPVKGAADKEAEGDDDLKNYHPPVFTNNALRHSHRFGLSWDETPSERKNWLESVAQREDFDDEWQENDTELANYVAMSDSESEEEDPKERERKQRLIRKMLKEVESKETKQKRRQERGLLKAKMSDGINIDAEIESSDSEDEQPGMELGEDEVSGEDEPLSDERLSDEESEPSDSEDNLFQRLPEPSEGKKRSISGVVKKVSKTSFDGWPSTSKLSKAIKADKRKKKCDSDWPPLETASRKRRIDSEPAVRESTVASEEMQGKKKRKKLNQLAKAKRKEKESRSEIDPELNLLLSDLKGISRKKVAEIPLAEDDRFAAILKNPEFEKDKSELLARSSARM